MKKFFNRLYKRIKVKAAKKMRRSMPSYEEVEPYEKTAFKICVKMVSHPKSDFMIAPMSNKRYIINEELSLFVIIDYGRVEITNHVFHYNVKLSARDFERLTYLYDNETEKRRNETEADVKANIKNSLIKVYNKISNN